MSATEFEAGPTVRRPKSLSASSLLQRAGLGLFILVGGTVASVWLYDASIKANALNSIPGKAATTSK